MLVTATFMAPPITEGQAESAKSDLMLVPSQLVQQSESGSHVWIVDAVEPETSERPAFAILVSEDGLNCEDVDLSHLRNPSFYTPLPK